MGNWKPPKLIRTLTIAIIRNDSGQILLQEGFDSVKNEAFYRPLGGGVEFGEKSEEALKREFLEEIDQHIQIIKLLHTIENIYTYEGSPGHEIVLIYEARMISTPLRESYEIVESGKVISKAVWRSLEEIQTQKINLYPHGIDALI